MTVDPLIQSLTLEEKAALLQGKSNWATRDIPRLGIPSMFLSDGPHGLRKQEGKAADHLGLNESVPATCFPTAAAMANSWNTELGRELGYALGAEAAARDVHVLLGPGLNMKRSPLCGRNFEYFSEDPYLAGKMAAAYIQGIQENGVAACPKHFAVNSQELRRMASDSLVDERTLREIYLTAFEIAVKEGRPKAIMSAYNMVNGVYANENAHLLREILREDWGFDGFVVTDWGASNDHTAGVRAGSALEMPVPGPDSALSLIADVRSGKISEEVLDDRLRELLPVVLDTAEAVANAPKHVDFDAHHALARKCAAEAIVLLENDGILPLKNETVALIGEFAEKPRYQGAGSSRVNPTMLDTLKGALAEAGLTVTAWAKGYDSPRPDDQLMAQAVAAAKSADTVLLCIGLDDISECEGMDRRSLDLPESHKALLQAVSQANPNIVLILSGGAPFTMPPQDQFRAAIHGYLGGQAGAGAMADALVGKVNPSGKLSETWPMALSDAPAAHFPCQERVSQYREGLYIGYRYYDTAGIPVRYPFGYGLSYTTFAYSDLTADSRGVSFTLQNTGKYDGSEAAQVYISCSGTAYRPKKELKAFAKVFLKAGESRRVTIELDDKAFRWFNPETNRFETETADYTVSVAASASDLRLTAVISVSGTEAPRQNLPSYHSGCITAVSDEEFARLLGRPIPNAQPSAEINTLSTVSELAHAKNPAARSLSRFTARCIEKAEKKGTPGTNSLFIYNMPLRSFSQMTGGMITGKMVDDLVWICNGHFFRGLGRMVRHFIRGRKEARAFEKALTQGQSSISRAKL